MPFYRNRTILLVRIEGLEPTRLSTSVPRTDVATNYTISPYRQIIANLPSARATHLISAYSINR